MTTIIEILLLTLFATDLADDRYSVLPGEYVNYSEPVSGMRLQRRVVLNCDHSVTATYRFDMINESVPGTWKTNSDTLDLIFNSDGEQAGHWDTTTKFLIDGNKLILVVSKIKQQNIQDKELLEKLMVLNKKQNAFKRTNKLKCG